MRFGEPARSPTRTVVVAVVCLLVLAAGWWAKARCLGDGTWEQGEQYYGYCYNDVAPLWYGRGLAEGDGPFGDRPLEYPVVLAVRIWLAATVAHWLPGEATVRTFFNTNALFVVAEVLATLALLDRMRVPSARLLWWATAPALFLYAFFNWDTLPVALMVGALLLHQRGHHTASGLVAGLGAAAKVFPGFLVPLVVLALLAQRRPAAAILHGGTALGVFVAVQVPAYLLAPAGWGRFYELSSERGMHVDSLWYLLAWAGGPELNPSALSRAGAVAFLAGASVVVALGARRRPAQDWWQLLLPVLVCFVLANKVYSPQYTLWLVPLMLLTLTRAAPFLAVAAADVLVHAVEFPYLAGRSDLGEGLPYPVLAIAVGLRAAALVWVLVEVVRVPAPSPPGREPQPGTERIRADRQA